MINILPQQSNRQSWVQGDDYSTVHQMLLDRIGYCSTDHVSIWISLASFYSVSLLRYSENEFPLQKISSRVHHSWWTWLFWYKPIPLTIGLKVNDTWLKQWLYCCHAAIGAIAGIGNASWDESRSAYLVPHIYTKYSSVLSISLQKGVQVLHLIDLLWTVCGKWRWPFQATRQCWIFKFYNMLACRNMIYQWLVAL